MQITLEPPEDIAQGLGSRWKDLPRLLSYGKPVFAGRARGSTKTTVSRRRPKSASGIRAEKPDEEEVK